MNYITTNLPINVDKVDQKAEMKYSQNSYKENYIQISCKFLVCFI